jgi:H+/Cl- antiporter ClcA
MHRGYTADKFRALVAKLRANCPDIAITTDIIVGFPGETDEDYAPTRALLEGEDNLPGVYTLLKFCATWLSAWTGVPGGVFAPSLAIGAGIGSDVAALAGVTREAAIPLIALGMVGFLAATTQGPITAFIIVLEMVSGHAMVLSLMASALVASGISRLLSAPLYASLAGLQLARLPTAARPAA